MPTVTPSNGHTKKYRRGERLTCNATPILIETSNFGENRAPILTSLALAPHVGLTNVRASQGVIEYFRSLLDPPGATYHIPTFFAVVIQSRRSLTTTPHTTHFRPLPLRGIAPKASRFFWRQPPPQDVAGRPPRVGTCTASRPNMTRFESLESPCRTRAPVNPS